MTQRIADCINILGRFCGRRDIPDLNAEELERKYNISQVDVMVLFGGSIICGGDVLANAIKNNIAKKYIIVGGAGHTTETLRIKMNGEFPSVETNGLSEAEIFANYLKYKYGLEADYLECNSTNCGNNITFLLDLLKQNNISFNSIILAQDATMQYRMEAGLRKYVNDNTIIINYAVYSAKVIVKNLDFIFEDRILGMWDIDRYINLLMGEIPRLSDNEEGYGPKGKGFIAHVNIPNEVEKAFLELKEVYSDMVREANPLYSSLNSRL
ncbi:hypothetical protein ABFP60_12320 [Clostridioides difficile]